MIIHVLLYQLGKEEEGIHSIDLNGKTIVLMFEDQDDAQRYCGLLEAQDFPVPSVEKIDQEEISLFCKDAGYEARFIEKGFIPKTAEERFLLAPPERNINNSNENNQNIANLNEEDILEKNEIDSIKKNLENLL